MANISRFLSYFVLLCLLRSYAGHPVRSSSQVCSAFDSFFFSFSLFEMCVESSQLSSDSTTRYIVTLIPCYDMVLFAIRHQPLSQLFVLRCYFELQRFVYGFYFLSEEEKCRVFMDKDKTLQYLEWILLCCNNRATFVIAFSLFVFCIKRFTNWMNN